ncbi:MAG: lipopolysaccharide biosynthesis protein [Treponema sp.]|nr:lipopolysaccharide biosynthesis protein [Treponema sp.]
MNNIKQKTKIGMIWNVLEKFLVQSISFVLNVFLARLLTPKDYGTIGMLAIFLSFSNVFIDSGFSRALIQNQNRTETDYSTSLIFNFVVGLVIYTGLFFASPVIASFYKTPELVSLQRVFFIIIILNSLVVVQNAKLQANIDFKNIAIINSVSSFSSGIFGIIAAYNGFGPWALVIQSLSKAFVSVLCFWIRARWFPKTGFSFESFKTLFGFGSKLLASGFLSITITNIENLFIGKKYSAENLGYYTRAQQFPELTSGTLASVLNNATFPLMSSLQDDKESLCATFKKLIRMTAMLVFPLMIGIALLSKPIILVLLGEKWLFSSELLFWLALSYIFTPLSILNMNILNAIGRSDLFLKVDLSKTPIIIMAMIITFPISIKAVVIGKVVCAFIYYYINAFMIGRIYSFGAFKQLACSWKYIVSSAIMAICVILADKLILSNFWSLIIGISVGIIVYTLFLLVLRDEEFLGMISKFLNRKARSGE